MRFVVLTVTCSFFSVFFGSCCQGLSGYGGRCCVGQQDDVPECAVLSAFAFLHVFLCLSVSFFGVCCSLCVLLFGTEVLDLPEHRAEFLQQVCPQTPACSCSLFS